MGQSVSRLKEVLINMCACRKETLDLALQNKEGPFCCARPGLADIAEETAHARGVKGGRKGWGEGGRLANNSMLFPSFLPQWHM